jgi:hypothetical protein
MQEVINVLQQIANNTASDSSLWIAAISGGSAVLGASVSAIISYFVTNRTIISQEVLEDKRLKANIVTTERLRWLQDMRSRLSALYAKLDMQYSVIKRPITNLNKQEIQDMLDEYSSEIMLQVNMITLMLNKKDKEQVELKIELQKILVYMQSCFSQTTTELQVFNDEQYSTMKTTIFNMVTIIGSDTWKQISNLE